MKEFQAGDILSVEKKKGNTENYQFIKAPVDEEGKPFYCLLSLETHRCCPMVHQEKKVLFNWLVMQYPEARIHHRRKLDLIW